MMPLQEVVEATANNSGPSDKSKMRPMQEVVETIGSPTQSKIRPMQEVVEAIGNPSQSKMRPIPLQEVDAIGNLKSSQPKMSEVPGFKRCEVPGVEWCGAEEPPYYEDLAAILADMKLEHHVPNMIRKKISLTQFLLLNEQKLKELTFLMPFERRIIMQNLKTFHKTPWLKKSIMRPIPGEDFGVLNLLHQVTSHYKHIAVISASIKALTEASLEKGTNESDKLEMAEAIETCQASLMDLKKQLKIVQNVLSNVTKATDENVLSISSVAKVSKPKRNWLKYAIYSMLPLVAVYSIKKLINKF
ncbi:uncharacterized protein LOC113374566 [Ctenocephalides felis]|uniref:uncharacterized protein LOC113374566 n=1 Tax=Ctenocephalides felis TaxID=7515 RepID=UPI000E6E2E60|nr:uncharacterized protein LOC113374566 [Ctenocephalides felis]XP_026470325.1 uncharacterized protein LOC113374566 [Ctenocephalides felis]XP_026470326.1 uncharacterized protein LOC113374566 [Ctenocephalides felis]XP_026470327.1 uncharacterized protein LOC113374566 [Ctenocephalides felis]XP_026470328.1 uncharacterized protein LOC113374566 [Ctenocephalides felis]XP_026470329.1 uncharacterized protein LOC113374566 [Ctenocephalides felis]